MYPRIQDWLSSVVPMRILIPLLGLLLLAGALRAVLGGDATDAPPPSDLEEATEVSQGPALRATGSAAQGPADAGPLTQRYRPVPQAIQQAMQKVWRHPEAKQVWDWIAADKRRYLDLLALGRDRIEAHRPARGLEQNAERAARNMITGWQRAGQAFELTRYLSGVLEEEGHHPAVLAGVVASLRLIDPNTPEAARALQGLASDDRAPAHSRLQALTALLHAQPVPPETLAALRALLKSDEVLPRSPLGQLLLRLRERPAALEALVPALLERATRQMQGLRARAWAHEGLLRCLLASGDRSHAMRNLFARASHSTFGPLQRQLQAATYGGTPTDVLEWMAQAPPVGRMVALHELQRRGVEPARLHPHLVAVLGAGNDVARQRAVDAIPLLGVPDDVALPVIEELLASDKPEREIAGVKALGMLAGVAGDHTAAVQQLYAVARSAKRPKVRIMAVQAILMHDTQPAGMIEVLGALLRDSEAEVRREAVDAMGELAAEHAAARRALEGVRNDADDDVRALIAYWLEETDDD